MKTILITGATSGIGLELARLYTTERLVLLGRKPLAVLNDPLFNENRYCQCDLSTTRFTNAVTDFLVAKDIQTIDLIIHNAGVGYYGDPVSQLSTNVDELLQVNLHAPIALTHALLPSLSEGGRLVFICSVAADLPVADYAVYGATKAALAGFARNLRLELSPQIKVQTVFPGAVRTDMHAKSGVPAGTYNVAKFPAATQVAADIKQAMSSERAEVTLGLANKLGRQLGRHLPGIVTALARITR